MRTRLAAGLLAVTAALLIGPSTGGSTPVATSAAAYQLCGRVFPDPHAYWPAPVQAPARSPFAKGNATCASVDFLSYDDMVSGVEYLETLFPQFVEFYELERDFGDGSDCTSSTSNADLCSAGLPQSGVPSRPRAVRPLPAARDRRARARGRQEALRLPALDPRHRARRRRGGRPRGRGPRHLGGLRGGHRDRPGHLREGGSASRTRSSRRRRPRASPPARRCSRSAVYFVFANPDGWRRGDRDNGVRFFQRYNGNGVDMNRDWPTLGFTFRPYTPWSEPETQALRQGAASRSGRSGTAASTCTAS